jgi:hypothetical protein
MILSDYDSSIITKIKENNKFWNRYRKTKITSHLVDVKKLRREIRQEVRREYLNFIRAAEDSLLNDPKTFWKFINQKKKTTSVPGSMIHGDMLNNQQDIINAFADHFANVFNYDQIHDVCDTSCYINNTPCDFCDKKCCTSQRNSEFCGNHLVLNSSTTVISSRL